MGRSRRFKSKEELERAWEEYKEYCDSYTATAHEFSPKDSKFVSQRLNKAITYTIEGFCVYVELSRSTFYVDYADNKKYSDTVTRMKEECEVDARRKFETGQIPTQLAGLWMSNYGYAAKTDANVSGVGTVTIVNDLED